MIAHGKNFKIMLASVTLPVVWRQALRLTAAGRHREAVDTSSTTATHPLPAPLLLSSITSPTLAATPCATSPPSSAPITQPALSANAPPRQRLAAPRRRFRLCFHAAGRRPLHRHRHPVPTASSAPPPSPLVVVALASLAALRLAAARPPPPSSAAALRSLARLRSPPPSGPQPPPPPQSSPPPAAPSTTPPPRDETVFRRRRRRRRPPPPANARLHRPAPSCRLLRYFRRTHLARPCARVRHPIEMETDSDQLAAIFLARAAPLPPLPRSLHRHPQRHPRPPHLARPWCLRVTPPS